MDEILKSLSTYMMIGIIAVVGVSQFNRVAGAILGVIFWIIVAFVGTSAYEKGHSIGIPGYPFPQPLFYLVCAVFCVLSAFTGVSAYKKRRSGRPPPAMTDDEDD